MITAIINGKSCSTISEFHALKVSKIKYSHTNKPIHCIADFYYDFLIEGKRLPSKNVVEEWHKLLVWYINQPDATFFVRKYEGGKENGEWNNRRGAVIQFDDGFEIVYASNFLAHEIFLMAYHGFVPSKDDFKRTIKNRELYITSGTKVEKKIRLYASSNKVLSYCYLAHIMDVNGHYLRDDGSYEKLSIAEEETIYPRGTITDWENSSDKIWHIPRKLNPSEKELVKAHCLRFLDPMNYYLTPLTNQCTHTVPDFKKNIGEYPYLTYYIQQQYRAIYGQNYVELIEKSKFVEQQPAGYTGKEAINLEYSSRKNAFSNSNSVAADSSKSTKSQTKNTVTDEFTEFINYVPNKNTAASYKSSIIKVLEDMQIADLAELEKRIDDAIDYCRNRKKAEKINGNKKAEKKYNDYCSALKKYKIFLESKNKAKP